MGQAGGFRNLRWVIRLAYFLVAREWRLVLIVAALALESLKALRSAPHGAIASLASNYLCLPFSLVYW
jgi:hypothetical protein